MDVLADPQIIALLLEANKRISNANEMYHGLCNLAARAARARARTPPKQGRGEHYPEAATGPSPMELCALIVAVASYQGIGRWPGKNNPKVHQICEALWKCAGGPPRLGQGKPLSPQPSKEKKAGGNWGKSGSETVVVWRRYLKTAQKYRPPHPAGKLIQHILAPDIRPATVHKAGQLSKYYDHPRSRPKERGGKKKG